MTADIGPVVKAVEQAVITRLNVTRPMRRIFGDEVAYALEVLLVQETHAAAAEVAKAAMDAARPIILREAADRMTRDYGNGNSARFLNQWADEEQT